MSFPLLSLPPRPLQVFLQCLPFPTLYGLSRCSKKSRRLIRKWSLDRVAAFDLEASFKADGYFILLRDQIFDEFCWQLLPTRLSIETPALRRVDRERSAFGFQRDEWWSCDMYHYVGDRREQLVIDILKELLVVFQLKMNRLKIWMEHIDDLEPMLNCPWFWRTEELCLLPGSVTEHEMTSILSQMQCVSLNLSCNPGPTYHFGTISVPKLQTEGLSRRQFFDLSCESILLIEPEFTNEDYNAFVMAWMDGKDDKLKALSGRFYEKKEIAMALDQEKILKGINWHPGRRKKYDPYPERGMPHSRLEKGLDIYRADGKMATLSVQHFNCFQQSFYAFLNFVVWHDGHEDVVDKNCGNTKLFY